MSTKRTKGETAADVGSTRTKKPKKKKDNNNETEAASCRTKKPKKKKDTTKKESADVDNNNDEKEKGEGKSNRNDGFSNEARIAMKQFTYQIVQAGLHQLRVQFNDLKAFVPADPSKKHFDSHQAKCRYKDVPCWDKTRIVLSWPPGVADDFVHANRITHELLEAQQIICCQGPLADTVADMWRCIWQENVKQIIMLCQCEEMGKNKCAQYWPSTVGEKMTFHGLTIKCDKIDATDRSFVHTKLTLSYDGKTRSLDHRQWTTWPDKSVPKTPMAPFRLLQYTRKSIKNSTIIHCSAGIGRTGTLVMIELMYKSLVKGKIPNVPQLVKDVRAQRAMAVQTEDQYLYCHYAILIFLHIKKIAPSHFIKHFVREYENYLKLLNDVGGKNLPMQATSLPQPCANCAKVAEHMNDAKQADSPPSDSKHEKKEESKRETGGAKNDEKNPERKANLIKQLKTQKEKKRGKKGKTVEEPAPEQPPPAHPPPAPEVVHQAVPTEEAKPQEAPVQNNQIQQPPPQIPQTPPAPVEEQPFHQSQAPQLQHSAYPSPAPPPPQQQFQPPQPQMPQQPQFQQPQQQQQYPAAVEFQQQPQQAMPQQVPQQYNPDMQQQKFQYTPAPTYTVQQAGNEKAIVYHRNANQPFIKAIASPAGVPQPMCLVQSNVPPQQQQQMQQQPPQQQNQIGVPFQPQQQF